MEYQLEVSEDNTLIWDKRIREELIIYISLVKKKDVISTEIVDKINKARSYISSLL